MRNPAWGRSCRHGVALGFALAWMTAGSLVGPAQAAERIERFHADIAIQADGSLEVSETIEVRAEGREIRRGIIREFPTRYRDRAGNRYEVSFEVLGLTRNGQPEPYWTERVSNGVEVFFGDDHFLEVPATHSYVLRYRTTRQLGFFDDFDELFWNVTGTGWIFPIDAASASVRLPEPVPVDQLRAEAYTGVQGASGRDYRAELTGPGQARYQTTRPLGVGEGLSLVLGFPKGIVAEPTLGDRLGWFLADNAGVLVALLGFGLLFGWYLLQWFRVGRDPAPGVIFPQYDPPEGHSPGGLRFMSRMAWDERCFTADLVDSAVHGALVIHREKPTREALLAQMPEAMRSKLESSTLAQKMLDMAMKARKELWRLERCTEADVALLPEAQRTLLGKLFERGPSVTLVNTDKGTVATMQSARNAHHMALMRGYSPTHFLRHGWVVACGVLWNLLYAVAGFVVAAGNGVPMVVVLGIAGLVATLVFARLMKQPTAQGRRLLDTIEGLKLYLGVAEKDELSRVTGPGEEPVLDAARYERLLPYAMALGVEDAWTGHFNRVASASAVAEASSSSSRWYRGNLANVGSLGAMSSALSTTLGQQIASSSSPPGSRSGSGGGGSSGGGGGGGGGRGR